MTTVTTPSSLALVPSVETAWQDVDSSFKRFYLTAGIGGSLGVGALILCASVVPDDIDSGCAMC
jgi:hypothetical protein